MLLREELRRDHDRSLVAIFDRNQRCKERDDRLPAANVSLQQPVHSPIARHVADDLANDLHLRAGQLERQRFSKFCRESPPILESDTAPSLSSEPLRALMQQMDEEQLLEGEPGSTPLRFGNRLRPMHETQRLADGRHTDFGEQRRREVLLDERKQRIEIGIEDRANDLERQSFRRRVHREHTTLVVVRVFAAEVDVFSRLELSSVEESYGPRDEEQITLVDAAVEERLSGPADLDHT